MANACTICNHSSRLEIDRALVAGRSHAGISREFGVSDDALRNHMDNHLSRQLIKSQELKKAMESGNLLTEIEDLLGKSKSIMKKAEEDGRLTLALNAIKETRGTLELMSKIAVTLHGIRAQELEAERMQNNAETDMMQQEGLERLSTSELDMMIAIYEKMAGERNDDVIAVTLEQFKAKFIYTPQLSSQLQVSSQPVQRSRRTRQPGIEVEEPEDMEAAALEDMEFVGLEEEPLEALDSLDLRDSPLSENWYEDVEF